MALTAFISSYMIDCYDNYILSFAVFCLNLKGEKIKCVLNIAIADCTCSLNSSWISKCNNFYIEGNLWERVKRTHRAKTIYTIFTSPSKQTLIPFALQARLLNSTQNPRAIQFLNNFLVQSQTNCFYAPLYSRWLEADVMNTESWGSNCIGME